MEFQNHLRVNCPKIKIKCSDCEAELTREEFREHSCYQLKKQESFDEVGEDLNQIKKFFQNPNLNQSQMRTMNVKFNDDIGDLTGIGTGLNSSM